MKRIIYLGILISIIFLLKTNNCNSQTTIVNYAQLHKSQIDTSKYDVSLKQPDDTLANWTLIYNKGKSIMRQPNNSPEKKEMSYYNKITGKFDTFITHNMSKNNLYYIDYNNNELIKISYFFDLRKTIQDSLPNYKWKLYKESKIINEFKCKRAVAIDPFAPDIFYDVWYTESIPLPIGPMGLYGLDGLILEVNRNGIPLYVLKDIEELCENDFNINRPKIDGKTLTLKEYQNLRYSVPFENNNAPSHNKKNK